MSADKDDPPGGPARTVFMPSVPPGPGAPGAEPIPAPSSGGSAAAPPEDRAAEDEWFSGEPAPSPASAAPPPPAPLSAPPASWDDVAPASLPPPPSAPAPAPPPEWTAPPSPPPSPLAGPPGWADPQPALYAWPANQSQPASPPSDVWGPDASAPPPPSSPQGAGRIAVGSVLNNIYEVRRFIARGGMGEVYEGVNTHTDERVAIKVMLSHLAEDANVQAMFRKEARTLTRLSHPALVQYRVLAQEPALKALYIVTEYIDGAQLADVIGKVTPDAAELEQLTRRLAAGLNAAHELGAIHRDMSPDNVLLPGGRLDQAKVIDFGIAKDLDPSNKTIVGDGFAGKMGFVAPEQFGDYGREVGPWTDIYSLALVILAVANGKPVDMGATLVDAIDKRRAGPSLDGLPERLRPTFAGMLAPDPAKRFRSMAEVLTALDESVGRPAPVSAAPPPAPPAAQGKPPKPPKAPKPTAVAGASAGPGAKGGLNPAVMIGGGVVALVGLAGLVFVLLPKGKPPATPVAATSAVPGPAAVAGAAPAGGGAEAVRQAVEAALPGAACTWMDVDDVGSGSGGVSLRLSGVANSPAEAQAAVSKAAGAGGAQIGLVDASNVFPIAKPVCAPLDTFRSFRKATSATGRSFVSQQSNWEIVNPNPPCPGGANAKAIINLKLDDPSSDFTIVGIEATGAMQQIYKDRATFETFEKQFPELITSTGAGSWRTTVCVNKPGLVGQLLITGKPPYTMDLPDAFTSSEGRTVNDAWLAKFKAQAQAKGWQTQMVWYRVVNDAAG